MQGEPQPDIGLQRRSRSGFLNFYQCHSRLADVKHSTFPDILTLLISKPSTGEKIKLLKSISSLLILLLAVLMTASILHAQENSSKQPPASNKKRVVFKIPDGFMPAEIPPDKKGFMMLNSKKPAGMFVAYTPDNQRSDDFLLVLRPILAGFFVSDKDITFEWKEALLPAHDGVISETGKIFTTSAKDKEMQVVAYTRTISEGQDVVYGYFAMKDIKNKKNSAEFVDATGKGVKEFDSFWKTVGVGK
jgi:hypothetical protein